MLWEVGRDGDEHSQRVAGSQSSKDKHGLLPDPAAGAAGLPAPEPGRTGATGQVARAPELSTAWRICSSALGTSPGSWRAGKMTAVAPAGKGG